MINWSAQRTTSAQYAENKRSERLMHIVLFYFNMNHTRTFVCGVKLALVLTWTSSMKQKGVGGVKRRRERQRNSRTQKNGQNAFPHMFALLGFWLLVFPSWRLCDPPPGLEMKEWLRTRRIVYFMIIFYKHRLISEQATYFTGDWKFQLHTKHNGISKPQASASFMSCDDPEPYWSLFSLRDWGPFTWTSLLSFSSA